MAPGRPIRRGSGKAHVVQEVVRSVGQVVYVSSTHPNGVTEAQYRKLIQDPAKARRATIGQRESDSHFGETIGRTGLLRLALETAQVGQR